MPSRSYATIAFILVLQPSWLPAAGPTGIPYEQALDAAAVALSDISDLPDSSLFAGNGDIYGYISGDAAKVTIRICKSDLWDARINTSNDSPIPTLDLIKRVVGQDTYCNNHESIHRITIAEPGQHFRGELDGFHGFPYPGPVCAGQVVLTSERSGKIGGQLDIRRARADLDGGESVVRFLTERNIVLIRSSGGAHVEPANPDWLDPVTAETEAGIQLVSRTIPGDSDWPGMSFTLALASRGHWKAVALVTSNDHPQPRQEAIRLAAETVKSNIDKLRIMRRSGEASGPRAAFGFPTPIFPASGTETCIFSAV